MGTDFLKPWFVDMSVMNCGIKIPEKKSPDYNITHNHMKMVEQIFF